jgi:Tol biopolymer transport system component
VLTDTYPDATQHRTLLLYRWNTGERIDIGRFHAPPMEWQIRCDLHPRWSRDGRQVCIDSIHEGTRQMYVIDVSDVVACG